MPTRVLALALMAAAATVAGSVGAAPSRAGNGAPEATPMPSSLEETGLYADARSGAVDARNLPFSPQYPLWSDGAAKRRWIFLPPRTAIDGSDPDRWSFPVGTKLWKEFAWEGRRVETRFMVLTRAGWRYATYAWNAEGTRAELAPTGGILSAQVVAPGQRHAIPGRDDCKNCHQAGRSEVLGFGALQLSPDRDPLAPNAEPVPEGGVTLATLVDRGLLRGFPRALLEPPPRIAATTSRGRAALGYLHANCGGCHDTVGSLASVGLPLRHVLTARTPGDAPAALAIGHTSRAAAPGVAPAESFWIAPGAPNRSTILTRMASRSPMTQMPPLGTLVVDAQAVALLQAWIQEDLTDRSNLLEGDHRP